MRITITIDIGGLAGEEAAHVTVNDQAGRDHVRTAADGGVAAVDAGPATVPSGALPGGDLSAGALAVSDVVARRGLGRGWKEPSGAAGGVGSEIDAARPIDAGPAPALGDVQAPAADGDATSAPSSADTPTEDQSA